jgi:peptide deformylase
VKSDDTLLLTILEWPHPILRSPAQPIERFDQALADRIEQMWYTMYHAPGIGLAAPQIADPRRLFVMDCGGRVSDPRPLVCANPKIIRAEGELDSIEGCLSFPELSVIVPRAASITLRAQDEVGTWFAVELEGLEAICAQHELDHLEGHSFLDLLEPLERSATLHSYIEGLRGSNTVTSQETISRAETLLAEYLMLALQ